MVTAPRGTGGQEAVDALRDRLAADPAWNGGWHYDHGGIVETMTAQRVETLQRYGTQRGPGANDRAIPPRATRRSAVRPRRGPGSSIPTRCSRCARRRSVLDAERDFAKIRARVLYVLSRTDKLFPPSLAPAVMDELARAGVQATYFEIDTELGHVASGPEWAKWGPTLRTFMEALPH